MAFQLNRLTFKASPGAPGTPTAVTILVGPNNSGKSLALREIADWGAGADTERVVVEELDVEWPSSAAEGENLLEPYKAEPTADEQPPADSFGISSFRPDGSQSRLFVPRGTLESQLNEPTPSAWLRQQILSHFVARLDGRARFDLVSPRPLQDLQAPAAHHLGLLFKEDKLREQVRDIVAAAFPGRYFVIDPTQMQQFRVRMSARPPVDSAEERGWDERAQAFHAAASLIEELSDGVVCFTGLVSAAVSLRQQTLLIDEPEAFLHPPLARLLGSSLSGLTHERGASLVAATHSAEFLMGCIESGAETTIVRLTYEQADAGARVLAPKELRPLIRDPLLRSTDALSGLFHRGVVVGESDHDRALYNEINRRLLDENRGVRDVFFTNAQNWQTVPRVIAPLRRLGVPAAAVIDLDTLTGAKGEWEKFYDAMSLSTTEVTALESRRTDVSGDLKALGKVGKKLKCKIAGIAGLAPTKRKKAGDLLDDLAERGVFVVPVGELEQWLSPLKVPPQSKGKWIVALFRALGSSPRSFVLCAPYSRRRLEVPGRHRQLGRRPSAEGTPIAARIRLARRATCASARALLPDREDRSAEPSPARALRFYVRLAGNPPAGHGAQGNPDRRKSEPISPPAER